jgi:hypothetical protein
METYFKNKENYFLSGEIPGEKYEAAQVSIVDNEEDIEKDGIDFFPLFETKDNIFGEIPEYVWANQHARLFLQQLAVVYSIKKNPSLSYTPIRVEQDESFFVLEWIFQDKRISFFFSENEDNKYSILYFNAKENTFINSVKVLSQERYKAIAEEVITFLS